MQVEDTPTGNTSSEARGQLSGLLTRLIERIPGAERALLGTGDGLKLAHTDQPTEAADRTAAVISGLHALARSEFQTAQSGGVRQVVVEHDAGTLFLMSAGIANRTGLGNTTLSVVAAPTADAGQVGHEMETFIIGLDEHLVVQARTNGFGQ